MRVYLGLGSNLGDRLANLRQGLALLAERGVRTVKASSLYQTEPVGFAEQPDFFNAVVAVEGRFTLPSLLRAVKEIERDMGGRPEGRGRARPFDADILLAEGLLFSSADLLVPHPRMLERRFVMEPLMELEPQLAAWWNHRRAGVAPLDSLRAQRVERLMSAEQWLGLVSGAPEEMR